MLQHPEWLLEKEEEVDWSKSRGTVLDASYKTLPTIAPLTAMPTFTHLTVLCLRESGVIDIELLELCNRLVHLDLSSNEVVHLVGGDFWASFPDLLVLLLHGNKVAEWRAVGGLGKAPKLTYLTLFFNPVGKRKMYRPFTTNCCESLRGLDLHAVSDEEVIEGSEFFRAGRYSTCSSALALPQPLFKGITETTFAPTQQDEQNRRPYLPSPQPTTEVLVEGDGHMPLRGAPNRDDSILASVMRRVQLLRRYHARNSPVIMGQRQVRRFLGERFGVAAAVKIQARIRRWMVERRAVAALKNILRETGELYLVQEMMTPTQLRSLAWFQRRIAGHFRLKALVTCAKTLERFVGSVSTKFSTFVDSLEHAQVGGVVVAHSQSGELAAAVAKALMVTTPGLSWIEASECTATMVTTVPDCRLLRPFSFVEMPDWPVLEKDVDTDGVFVSRSAARSGTRAKLPGVGLSMLEASDTPPRTQGLRETRPHSRVPTRLGVFGSPRIQECKVSRRNCAIRKFCQGSAAAKRRATTNARRDMNKQLWAFRPLEVRLLARVLCTLRNESMGKPPVPFILERPLFRCASATRIQAAWRGHVLRWTLSDTLASCVIVSRAGVCIQRWWRYQTGLALRLRLCRRLWALATAVSSPTLYVELDVFYTLTRGWKWNGDEEGVAFTFQSGNRVAVMSSFSDPPSRALGSKGANDLAGHEKRRGLVASHSAARDTERHTLEFPMSTLKSVVRQVLPSKIRQGAVLTQVGALLTVDVKAKKVIWPLAPATTDTSEPAEGGDVGDITTSSALGQSNGIRETSSESSSTGICLTSARSEEVGSQTHPTRAVPQREDSAEAGPPISLRTKNGDDEELLELTFSSTQEARARAVLLALATEEPGVAPNRAVAQLMTLGMLRRAAAGEQGQALPMLKTPAQGFRRGDAVEVSLFRLSEGRGGAWFPAVVDRRNGCSTTYKVTLETGYVEHHVPEGSMRPRDCTGVEPALVEMSHIPSRWQRNTRSLLTPADRLELELLRRSLPTTTMTKPSVEERPLELLSANPRREAEACMAAEELRRLNGLGGRGLVLGDPRPISPGSPVGRADPRAMGPSPPRWAGSQTMAAARTAGGVAERALEKVARAAVAADAAAATSTWVPGNRFRVGLEKLVQMAAHEAQDAAKEVELSARRDTVSRARQTERIEPSPRCRVEKLKAAEVAIFRREADEISRGAALERAIHDHELKVNAAEAREYMRDGKRLMAESVKADLENQKCIIKKRESDVEEERQRNLDKRNADVDSAKARVAQRRKDRAKQELRRAESNTFTANASQLARHVCKHAAVSYRAQNTRGMRRWAKGNKNHEEDGRRRMLRRVQELQEQKRKEGTKLRRVLAARSRARAAMDEAVVRHRVGQAGYMGDGVLAESVMHVLRPSGGTEGLKGEQVDGVMREDGESRLAPFGTEDGGKDPHRVGSLRERRPDNNVTISSSTATRGGVYPSKPETTRPPLREQTSRRLRANDTGKTVVVLASVPTVTRESRAGRPLQGTGGAALLGSTSSHSMISPNRDAGAAPNATSDQAALPWPLGRRCW
ncbi:unnamed protein product [Ectocarpus sp. 12 AP-2014]